ncbi:oligopeptide:H+ symporter [Photobacterium rosenbergii]|uniref:oligopeptide:H+ symporter n=1 Tax=Photobacterium rosenbergii TaxID=294936 RepID=UPI001C99E9C8|nr:oligopeptide:H+ symporter [Photobacterium rosenbergii]MBY5944893.1 oligopeptide:H+ symporter [Photobacterium rosenbergii]
MSIAFSRQPSAFKLMCIIILPAMLSMYGLVAIVTVFMVNDLGMSESDAFLINGAASAFSTIIYAIGGYLADKVIGVKRSLIIGNLGIVLTLLLLSYAAAIGSIPLAMIGIAGGGVSRALANNCPSNLISKAYRKDDIRIDSAFTLYYMMINIGSCISLIITPIIAHKYSYSAGFAIAAMWNVITIAFYLYKRDWVKNIGADADFKVVNLKTYALLLMGLIALTLLGSWLITHYKLMQILLVIALGIALTFFINYMRKESWAQQKKMIVSLILLGFSVVFFILYKQMPTSLTFFAIHNTRHEFLGIPFDPVSTQALNPFWIIILSPLLAIFYERSSAKGKGASLPLKFAMGMLFCSMAFLCLAYGASFMADETGRVSAFWLILTHLFQGLGELLISALGISVLAQLVPNHMIGFTLGFRTLTLGISSMVAANLAVYIAVPESSGSVDSLQTLPVYASYFLKIGIGACIMALIMFMTARKLDSLIENRNEEEKEQVEAAS